MGEEELTIQKSTNDNSNPQQGTGAPYGGQPITNINNIKIPPTIKDDRKLFVGGLPSDGKWEYTFMHVLPHFILVFLGWEISFVFKSDRPRVSRVLRAVWNYSRFSCNV